ncbi:7588_t:CDS:2 [Funneliformis geosporum]|uniref:7588_t:CDS:1 n=1 Tax=Funneliformis geosporum TaxID=1117311 RepID=A0A9W4WJS3_9GLOM|nr:7588_t:CDS:2 [Funneliformis geosporum]
MKVTEQDLQEVDELVTKLSIQDKTRGKGTKRSVKKNDYVHQLSGIAVSSWKMNEWDYKKGRTPTKIRGLFTRQVENRHEIIIRGYDKFFNVGEMPETTWEHIEMNTVGPYEITVKENGCIIFIGGLPGDHILVTSKHSMGVREDAVAHAIVGEKWLDEHLEKAGKTKQALASFLYENRLTAVAELCDDQFEEHVLPYNTPDRRGLYLHGMNLNTVNLKTWPSEMVANFAKEWGFLPIHYYVKPSITEVKSFINDIRQDGSLEDGIPIEGFVVRTKTISSEQDFFFKVKYDEPYLMYREWREITKALLNKKNPKTTYKLSRHYLEWVREKIKKQPELFKGYQHNHGIFRVRDMFLEYWKNRGGIEGIPIEDNQQYHKTLLVPIGTIGCAKLFSFVHIQNDNIVMKKPRLEFHKIINESFKTRDVVIADRNNHLKYLRRTLIEAVKEIWPKVRIVAIYWNHDRPDDEIFQITSKRIVARGENHQSLTPSDSDYEKVIWRFLEDFEPLDSNNNVDDQFDDVIDLDIANDIKTNLEIVIDRLQGIIGIEKPGEDAINNAIDEIKNYKPSIRKRQSSQSANCAYVGIALDFNIRNFLTEYFKEHSQKDPGIFKELVQRDRIKSTFHVTLINRKELKKGNSELWKKCIAMCGQQVKIYISKIIANAQIMALAVDRFDPENVPYSNKCPHVTVGTISDDVKPVQANSLCESVLRDKNSGNEGHIITLEKGLELTGTIKGFNY